VPKTLRVQLAPVLAGGQHDVVGCKVSFTARGAALTKAVRGSTVAAKITLFGRFLRKVREGEQEERKLLTLEGELTLESPEGRPVFKATPGKDGPLVLEPSLVSTEPVDTTKPRKRRRTLTLAFDPREFPKLHESGKPLRLLLPEDTDQFRFLEFEATLEVAGAEEADRTTNDVLDAPVTAKSPPPLPLFDLLVVDEVGQPLPGVAVTLTHLGKDHELTTDDNGVVLLPVDAPGVATARITDLAALRDTLRARWNEPREGRRVESSETTAIAFLVADEAIATVIDAETPACLSIQPYVSQVRTVGALFDTNKTFLLPSALPGLQELRAIYEENDPGTLLVVGHTDTAGDPSTNDPLSLERARSVAAFLADEVDPWLEQFGSGVPERRRWGAAEEAMMASALPDFAPVNETPLKWFERTRFPGGSPAADAVRKRLITEYMALDGANVEEAGLDIDVVTHGCGENFPLDGSGQELDTKPADGKSDSEDRRVELFFFDKQLGVQPKVDDGSNSKKGSKEYPEWRRRGTQLQIVRATGEPKNCHVSVLLFSNSACVPLAKRPFELSVRGGKVVRGTTDDDGFLSHGPVAAGDHVLVIDGTETIIGATRPEIERRPHMVQGHVLVKATL
jgi:outer membrane protein OmpA-like peptidoglycan-associated protein